MRSDGSDKRERDRDRRDDGKTDREDRRRRVDSKKSSRDRSYRESSRKGDKRDERERDRTRDKDEGRSSKQDVLSESEDSYRESRKSRDRRRRRRRDDESEESRRREKSSKRRRKNRSSDRKKPRKRSESPSESEDATNSDDSNSEASPAPLKKVVNEKLLAKLAARGETLEEWRERKGQKRAAKITSVFGYTAEDNPFNDPNIHETFAWKKKEEKVRSKPDRRPDQVFEEIEKVRKRRRDRELHFEELERLRAEESRMKELENYDEWARKEEEFHLQQQKQRSAIRLIEGREKPIDVLAKNLLMFGLSEEDEKERAAVKYKERYNALEALDALEVELEEPYKLFKVLKLDELQELVADIQDFISLEREASGIAMDKNPVLSYWVELHRVGADEVKLLQSGGDKGSHAEMVRNMESIFDGQARPALWKMKEEIGKKLSKQADAGGAPVDPVYWQSVLDQLNVKLAKMELSEFHSKMLVRQLEKLEKRKEDLKQSAGKSRGNTDQGKDELQPLPTLPKNTPENMVDLDEELGLTNEHELEPVRYSWQDKYRPRKPRFFNRVKTGYDWNKYNQTHYDHDNPPPKIVQGYKFNIFYPDLVDPSKTPQFFLEPAESDEFCIIRFHAGPPYEDVAFKIINREWNRSRKRGFRCTFERGVLSLYFNFATHWYRR